MATGHTGILFAFSTWMLVLCIIQVESLAIFEANVVAFSNPSNKIATGQCCQTGLPVSHSCSLNCHTRFEVCLDDLHLKGPTCTFGKNSSQVFPTSNLRVNGTSLERSITISTSLSWPGVFGLKIEAIDNSTRTLASKGVIQSVAFVDMITPGYEWKTKNDSGPVSSFVYKYRVVCAANYFGLNCTIYCKPRDDSHGHYRCYVNGTKYCLPGWRDISDYCRKPICTQTCLHGRCTGPNFCSCNSGWIGPLCSTCQTRIGCVNGTCTTPGGCNCNTGWGGTNCDKETDYCGMRKPCRNGGKCINNGLGAFRCYCLNGYTGLRCETAITACTVNPCRNGGSCQVVAGGYKCNCTHEYTGTICETRFDPCASFQCLNNGNCSATGGHPSCNCLEEFKGHRCESSVNVRTSVAISKVLASAQRQSYTTLSTTPSSFFKISYGFIRASTLSSSYQLESTERDLASRITSRDFTYTHTDFKSTYAVRSQTALSQATIRLTVSVRHTYHSLYSTAINREERSSPTIQGTTAVVQRLTIQPSQSNSLVTLRTIISKDLLSPTIPRFSPTSALSTETIKTNGSHTALRGSSIISSSISAESNFRLFSTNIVAPVSSLFSTSIVTSKGPTTHIRKTQYQGSSKRSMAIGISISISFVIIIAMVLAFAWFKLSKKRGEHRFRTPSTVVPESMNNPCKLLDAGYLHKSSAAGNIGHYAASQMENSSSVSDRSQAVSSKDINIDSTYLQLNSHIDTKDGYLNTCNSYSNFGYLSEGTSGYESENSSARSSANFTSRSSKSPLSTRDIVVAKFSGSNKPSADLPNCITYSEEYQEVEL